MMTYAWTLQWILLNPSRKPGSSTHTMAYILALLNQLTPEQQLYAELSWADPIGTIQ